MNDCTAIVRSFILELNPEKLIFGDLLLDRFAVVARVVRDGMKRPLLVMLVPLLPGSSWWVFQPNSPCIPER